MVKWSVIITRSYNIFLLKKGRLAQESLKALEFLLLSIVSWLVSQNLERQL